MAETITPEVRPDVTERPDTDAEASLEPGYLVICWNDPVNLMTYVTHVFMRVFGWPRTKAERHMLEVHEQGRSLLTRDSLERAEFYVHRLQHFGLQATLEREAT
ncbi:MAG: ATP-dependent Clp protease adaptor ClpS [Verrucomicrobiales bacterium]|nr:ATP-dependent Clp protease adaptor ClpS [Verrucomicrobiales bacterium]